MGTNSGLNKQIDEQIKSSGMNINKMYNQVQTNIKKSDNFYKGIDLGIKYTGINSDIINNEVQSKLNSLNKPIDETLKQIEINTYYYKKYKSENKILYFIIFILILIIIINIIKKRFPFFDDLSYSIIIGIILGASLLYIIYLLWDAMNKDDQNYDEYAYEYDAIDYSTTLDISNNINTSCLKPGYLNTKYSIDVDDISYDIEDIEELLTLF